MKLREVDKAIYRDHLRKVTAGVVVTLLSSAVGISTVLIALFGVEGESHLILNATGVAIGAGLCGVILYAFRQHPYMDEVWYVWLLKQELNRIYRQSAKLKRALKQEQSTALVVHYFHLQGSKQLYELDDNTLTMEELTRQIAEVEQTIARLGLTISTEDYDPELLNQL